MGKEKLPIPAEIVCPVRRESPVLQAAASAVGEPPAVKALWSQGAFAPSEGLLPGGAQHCCEGITENAAKTAGGFDKEVAAENVAVAFNDEILAAFFLECAVRRCQPRHGMKK